MKNFNLPDNFYLKEKMLELYETGSYFVNLPSRSDQSFEEGYHSEPVDPDGHVRQLISDDERAHKLMNFQKEIIDELYLVTSEKRTIIDIGCGPGWLLSTLDDSWNKFGVEISSFAADIAKQHGDIACVSVENFVAPLESFDVVILHHVIEHLADPLRVIEKIHQMLKPGGLLIISAFCMIKHTSLYFQMILCIVFYVIMVSKLKKLNILFLKLIIFVKVIY